MWNNVGAWVNVCMSLYGKERRVKNWSVMWAGFGTVRDGRVHLLESVWECGWPSMFCDAS